VRFDPYYMTSVYIKDENDIKTVHKVVFDRLYWDRLDDGTISDCEVKKAVCERLPERLHFDACKVYDNWIKNLPFIEGMEMLIDDLKNYGCKIFLLSNISCGFAENYSAEPDISRLFSKFDGLVFSGPLGITKPSKEIFLHLLQKYGLKAEETIFIDDSEKNIKGAEAVGIS